MAKPTVPRHSKTTRKPVVIDLDPSDVKSVEMSEQKTSVPMPDKPVPSAEPVGNTVNPVKKEALSADVSASIQQHKIETEHKQAAADQVKTASRPASSAGVSGPNPYTSGKPMNSAASSTSPNKKTASSWLAGIVGGVIVLLGVTALQWTGLSPFAAQSGNSNETEQAVNAQIADLKQQIAALQAEAKSDADLLMRLEAAEKNAAQVQKRISELPQPNQVAGGNDKAIRADLTTLQEQLKALAARAEPADNALVNSLTERLNMMETKLYTIASQTEQASAAQNTDNDAVQALKQQLAALQAKIDGQASQPDMAAIVAVNALKAAIDRGGSYLNELQTYTSLVPAQTDAAANLDVFASTGIPTLSQLNTQFPALADEMVAVVNKPAADAGVWDQLVGSAKGLVRSRPVGDVAGADVGPVTARIEFALQNGDVQRAITEWAQLPEVAKQAGQSFYNALAARRDGDALTAKLIAATMQTAQ